MSQPLLLSYRTLGIGDLLTAVPALRGLRDAFPEHQHVLVTPEPLAPLVRLIDAVDRHVPAGELAPLPWEVHRPAVAVNLHGSGPRSHRLVRTADPHRMIAFHHPDAWPADDAPRWDPSEHEVHRWCRLLGAHDIVADPTRLALEPPDGPVIDGAEHATVIHPGAKAPSRRWPAERFAAIARAEHRAGRRVLVTGGPQERPLASRVAAMAGLGPDVVLAGRHDLDDLARCVAVAGRVVCGDTGVAHLATAFGTPSVILFGPTPPAQWGPPVERRDRHRVLWTSRTGDPHGDEPDPGLLEITVQDVLEELCRLDAAAVDGPALTGRPGGGA